MTNESELVRDEKRLHDAARLEGYYAGEEGKLLAIALILADIRDVLIRTAEDR